MSLVAKVIKALEKAQAAEEEPTAFESMVMLKLVGKLQANTLRAEEESSESSSDNCSEESDESDDDSEDVTNFVGPGGKWEFIGTPSKKTARRKYYSVGCCIIFSLIGPF